MTFRNGLDSLLRPEDSVLVLIDHQPYQLANLNSHDPQAVVNNTTALAKTAKVFGVPTILTSVIEGRGGLIFKHITDVFPGQEVIDRTMRFPADFGDYQRQLFNVDGMGLPHKAVLEQIDLLGEEVVPVLRKEFAAVRKPGIPDAPLHPAVRP